MKPKTESIVAAEHLTAQRDSCHELMGLFEADEVETAAQLSMSVQLDLAARQDKDGSCRSVQGTNS